MIQTPQSATAPSSPVHTSNFASTLSWLLRDNDAPDFDRIGCALDVLPSLGQALRRFQHTGNTAELDVILEQRERALSVATLSAKAMRHLFEVAREAGV